MSFTANDVELLRLIADGTTHDAIARRLGKSRGAVAMSANRLYRKLDALNAAHAVAIAFRLGLIE